MAGWAEISTQEFKVLSLPHDVACTPDGIAWYSAQRTGALGRLDPKTGAVKEIPLGKDSSPHGVIVGPDGALWLTDGGQNAIARVDPGTEDVKLYPAPPGTPYMNLNTAAFDGKGVLWFTGQAGYYGKVDPKTGEVKVWKAPKGRGPYGIAATPKGDIYYASLAGSHIARIDTATGQATVIEPPNKDQGARRVWSDSKGAIWVSEWNSGHVSRYDPADKGWKTWKLPTEKPLPYAVYVDEKDKVWLSDFGGNAMIRFDPASEKFEVFKSPREAANVRQILGCPGQVWAPESGTSMLVVFRY
ncbi:MAG: lyase [Alphaproteobacteria bacterium]|nr:lyase [Alphaproteobacteria bacterium]